MLRRDGRQEEERFTADQEQRERKLTTIVTPVRLEQENEHHTVGFLC